MVCEEAKDSLFVGCHCAFIFDLCLIAVILGACVNDFNLTYAALHFAPEGDPKQEFQRMALKHWQDDLNAYAYVRICIGPVLFQ